MPSLLGRQKCLFLAMSREVPLWRQPGRQLVAALRGKLLPLGTGRPLLAEIAGESFDRIAQQTLNQRSSRNWPGLIAVDMKMSGLRPSHVQRIVAISLPSCCRRKYRQVEIVQTVASGIVP
jgi:hypothetical protein